MSFVLITIFLGFLTGYIAKQKGRNFFLWFIFGFLLFIVAFPMILLKKANLKGIEANLEKEGLKKCPFCAEMVKAEASVCKHCGKSIS